MYNIVSKGKQDPTTEFGGVYYNENTGSIWVWVGKPVLIGFSGEGRVLRADTFSATFKHEEKRNKQKYTYEFPYTGIPVKVIAKITKKGFHGSDVSIFFGSKYGAVREEGVTMIAQTGNVSLNGNLKIDCLPISGELDLELIILTYE